MATTAHPHDSQARPAAAGDAQDAAIRRGNRVRLLKDLVSNGLYRVDTELLADRLVDVLAPPRDRT